MCAKTQLHTDQQCCIPCAITGGGWVWDGAIVMCGLYHHTLHSHAN